MFDANLILALGALVSNAHAFVSNSSAPVDFVTGTYSEFSEVEPFALCPGLNFNFKDNHGTYYPPGTGKVVKAYDLGNDDYEIVFSFAAESCPPLSNLDQAAIIGVDSPESSMYTLHDSNQDISLIADPCSWSATFVVKGVSVGELVCAPDFQIHYSWFSGKASSDYAASFNYHSAYEYSMGCFSDNNNNAQTDFSQYCWLADDIVPSSSASTGSDYPGESATTKSSTASSSSAAAFATLYGQCGGINWTGATACVEGATCSSMNPWYYQCVAPTTAPTTAPSSVVAIPSETPSSAVSVSTVSIPSEAPSSAAPSYVVSIPSSSAVVPVPSSSAAAPAPSSSIVYIPSSSVTYVAPTSSSISSALSSSISEPSTTIELATLYDQCGGQNWEGATACVQGAVCSSMNPWYYQCVTNTAYVAPTSTLLTSAVPSPTVFAELYGQCGGQNWSGATACGVGAICSSMNPWYYQCVTNTAYVAPTSTSVTSAGPEPTVFAELYGQCGGQNWSGATACVEGATCSSMNAWYYQCVSTPTAA